MTVGGTDSHASPIDPTGELHKLASDCVHCGFCLPACPTYELWGEEMDSPRGRIHLITQILDGSPATETAAAHLDRCLGCMACVPACPSGVQYDRLIEAARTWSEEPPPGVTPVPPRSARERAIRAAIFATFPYPRRLRLLSGPLRLAQRTGLDRFVQRSSLAARVAPEMAAALRIAPTRRHSLPPEPAALEPAALEPAGQAARAPVRHTMPMQRAATPVPASGHLPAQGERRAVVGMLTGCVQRVFFPEANAATARVLAAEGCEVVIPGGQGCCGALSLHSGRKQEAARFARRAIAVFERAGVDTIVVNSAGCGSAMKEYGLLLAQAGDDWADRAARTAAKVRDFSEFLAELTAGAGGSRAPRHPLPVRAAYHEACHLGQAQRIRKQPRDLLRAIPGLELAEVTGSAACCGSAGVYNLLQPEAAGELGARKAASVLATGADLVISANPGCSLQIATAMADTGHSDVPAVMHTAEVIDASVRGVSVAELIGSR